MHLLELIRLIGVLACCAAAIARFCTRPSRREQKKLMSDPRPPLAAAFPEVNHRYDAVDTVDTASVDAGVVNLKKPSTEPSS